MNFVIACVAGSSSWTAWPGEHCSASAKPTAADRVVVPQTFFIAFPRRTFGFYLTEYYFKIQVSRTAKHSLVLFQSRGGHARSHDSQCERRACGRDRCDADRIGSNNAASR